MKYYNGSSTFHFSWDQVACAFWKRYPNPYSKHVLTEDVLSRDVLDNKLFTKRLLKKTNRVTKFTAKVTGGATFTYVIEESIIDPIQKLITTYTRNIGMQRFVSVEEKVVFKVDPSFKEWVVCEKQAWITSPFYGLGGTICSIVHQRWKSNTLKASKGFIHVLENLYPKAGQSLPINSHIISKEFAEKAKQASEYAKKIKPLIPKS